MADVYTYTFDGRITNTSGTLVRQASGIFSVDYDTNRITYSNILVNGINFSGGVLQNYRNSDGSTGYTATFVSSPTGNDTNSLTFNYDQKLENALNNLRYIRIFTDYSTPTPTTTYTDLQSAAVPTTTSTVCFTTGTRIRTARGEVPVEDLRIGDQAVTSSGALRPVVWFGHRTVRCQGRKDLLPVRIAKDAFGPNRPSRDLVVSPGHALCVDLLGEVLIPACRLINGTTITQVATDTVTYWHVELDAHDILLAEGMPAESYLDCGNRGFFANAEATALRMAPDLRPEGPLPFCRPFHETGPVVDFARARLGDRAAALGWRLVEDRLAGLHLVADGRVIEPEVDDLSACFVLPAGARDVRLVSETSVPAHVLQGSTDDRHLGLPVMGLAIDGVPVAIDDPQLCEGWHGVDDGTRWTEGAAVLPAALWEGRRDAVTLRVDLSVPALPRWVAPDALIEEPAVALVA